MAEEALKLKTARTLKWNSIDRFSSQVLYAVTGVVLANVLPREDFGLVGVILMFQAFAVLFVDSGFGTALLQKKEPTQADYSTVFWFNMGVSAGIYCLLWFCAPAIADLFGRRQELVSMSRVMFLTFIFTAVGIVQTNQLIKRMDVRQVAIANLVSQIAGGGLGIGLALGGFGAWALVWQSVTQAAVKSGWLWCTGGWCPSMRFSRDSLRAMFRVGLGVFTSCLLNVGSLNAYTFVIGVLYPMSTLGVYTQADKWSKMGYASLSQIFNTTFIPLLSRFQDDAERYRRAVGKANRLCAFIACPLTAGLIVMAAPLFHLLFGTKWDAAIPLFQILVARGLLIVLISQANTYLLALGRAGRFVAAEVVKDVLTVGALFASLPFGTVEALVWGQFFAALLTYIYVLWATCRSISVRMLSFLRDMAPYTFLSAAVAAAALLLTWLPLHPALLLAAQGAAGLSLYVLILRLSGSVILREAAAYLLGRFRRHHAE